MRVLIAHNRYRLPGGEERHVDLLERGLAEAGVETRRFERASSELDGSPAKRAAAAVTLAYRPGGGGIAQVLEEWRPDVVHFHNIWPFLTPAALRIAKRQGAKVILTCHNYRFACPGGTLLRNGVIHDDCIEGSSLACGLRGPRNSRAEGIAYGVALEVQRRMRLLDRWSDLLIAPSEFLARALVRSGLAAEKVRVVAYGVPISPDARLLGSHVLFAGRLADEKGIGTLLQAAALAPDVPIVIAGDGPLAPEVRRHNGSIRYVGQLKEPELVALRREAMFSVVPSECHEVMPFSVLESLAAGLPVVTTSLGGLPEVVDDGVTGLVVGPHDAPALASAMQRLSRDRAFLAALGASARRIAEERFSLARQTSRLIELYGGATRGTASDASA
jgi:glycosyltransferase involved in cell wall biosynthesis